MLSDMRVYFCDESIAQSVDDITTVTAVGIRCSDIGALDRVVRSFRDRLLREHMIYSGRHPVTFEIKGSYLKDRNVPIYLKLLQETLLKYDLDIVSKVGGYSSSPQHIQIYRDLISGFRDEGVFVIDYFAGIGRVGGVCIVPVSSSDSMLVQLADVVNSLMKVGEKFELGLGLSRYELRMLSLLKEYRGSRN